MSKLNDNARKLVPEGYFSGTRLIVSNNPLSGSGHDVGDVVKALEIENEIGEVFTTSSSFSDIEFPQGQHVPYSVSLKWLVSAINYNATGGQPILVYLSRTDEINKHDYGVSTRSMSDLIEFMVDTMNRLADGDATIIFLEKLRDHYGKSYNLRLGKTEFTHPRYTDEAITTSLDTLTSGMDYPYRRDETAFQSSGKGEEEIKTYTSWGYLFADEIITMYELATFCNNCKAALPKDYQGKHCRKEDNPDCYRKRQNDRKKRNRSVK